MPAVPAAPLPSAVVTGSAQGIGRAVARRLAAAGHPLVLLDRADQAATVEEVRAAGGEALALTLDLTDDAARADAVATATDRLGVPGVLVNNAGVSLLEPAESTSTAAWERVLAVNLTAPFVLCRELGTAMLAAGGGAIVNVASIAGLHAVADRAAYNASKHGLVGLTRTLAAEWGGRGVRINAVCPGWVKTEMDEADQAAGGYTDADVVDRVPMGRFATPEDVAEAVAFLADARAGFVNGVALPVDGGWTADASWDALRLRKR